MDCILEKVVKFGMLIFKSLNLIDKAVASFVLNFTCSKFVEFLMILL